MIGAWLEVLRRLGEDGGLSRQRVDRSRVLAVRIPLQIRYAASFAVTDSAAQGRVEERGFPRR